MKFKRPVDASFPISAGYKKQGRYWGWIVNERGFWQKGRLPDGTGFHKGIDFSVPTNTLVTAMADGLITRAGWENDQDIRQGFGQRVRQQIEDEQGLRYELVYGHLSKLLVKEGDQVMAGDQIAFSGNTGKSSGPHLHVERVRHGQYHDIEFDDLPTEPIEIAETPIEEAPPAEQPPEAA